MSAVEDGTASMILQPTRLRIIRFMMKAGAPVYIDQIARELSEDPQLVSFHLDKMEDNGLVKSILSIVQKSDSKRGWAGRFFEPTSKLKDVFGQVASVAAEVREGLDDI
jgi:DNA-binding transcriptional ArsR family regulator